MKIILVSVGTRGDMEPFLAIGEMLNGKGHHVICAFPEQFMGLANESGLKFASLGSKYINLLDSEEGRAAMGGASGWEKIAGTVKLALNQKDANKELLIKQKEIIEQEKPDRVIYNGKAVYPVIWKLKNRGSTIFVSPLPYMHYVKGHTHVAFNSNLGTLLNKLTFSVAHFGMITTIKISMKWLNMRESFKRKEILDVLKYNKSIYTISPALFHRPEEWHENLKVLGYHYRLSQHEWKPDTALCDFVDKHKKILFVTFGSMTNTDPVKKTGIILSILERNNIPAVINTAAGGLVRTGDYNSSLIHFVSQIPYEWIFPRTYAVIHHGGSGTTHLALRNGCVTMILPHIIDQFVWNKIIYQRGIGPEGIRISRISIKNLEPKILDLMNNSQYKEKAEQISHTMEKEHFEEELYRSIIE